MNRTVRLAFPGDREGPKCDFNDLLQSGGIEAVRAALQGAGDTVSDVKGRIREFVTSYMAEQRAASRPLPRGVKAGVAAFPLAEQMDRDEAEATLAGLVRNQLRAGVLWSLGDKWGDDLRAAGLHPGKMPAPLVVNLTAGTGKTESAIRGLVELLRIVPAHIPLHIAWLDRDHAKAAELAARAKDAGLPVIHLRGRSQLGPDGKTMCDKPDLADQAHELGLPVHSTICARPGKPPCASYSTCGFFRQAEVIPDRCILIGTHHALVTGYLPGMVPLPSLVIVDEGATKSLRRDPMRCKVSELRELVDRARPRLIDGLPEIRAVLDMLELSRTDVGDWRAHLSAHDVPLIRLAAIASASREAMQRNAENPADESAIRFGFALRAKDRFLPVLVALLEALQLDWENGREGPQSVIVDEWQGNDGQVHVSVCVTPALPLIEGRAILALDASAGEHGTHALYGPDARLERIAVARRAYVVQIPTPSFSKLALGIGGRVSPEQRDAADKLILDLERMVALLVARDGAGNVGMIIPRDLRMRWTGEGKPTGFVPWRGVLLGHFGALRGLDAMRDCQAVVVVGCQQPMRSDVERLARGDYARDPTPLCDLATWGPGETPPDFPMVARGLCMEAGPPLGFDVRHHPDLRIDEVLRQIRDEEVIQAVDRIRSVRADAPKTIYLLSPVVLPLPVAELWGFDAWLRALEAEAAALRDGVLPLTRESFAAQAGAVLEGRGGVGLTEGQERKRARDLRDDYFANSERLRRMGRGRRSSIQKIGTPEWKIAGPSLVCAIVPVGEVSVERFLLLSNEIEQIPTVLSAMLRVAVKAVLPVGYDAAAERKAGSLDLLERMTQMADAHTHATPRCQGESVTDHNQRLAGMEVEFGQTRDRWLATVPHGFAARLRQADLAARGRALLETVEIAREMSHTDAEVALDALDPFVVTMPDGKLREVAQLPCGGLLAAEQSAVNDLVQSLELRRLLGLRMTYEMASRPFMRLLLQEGEACCADPALAARLGVPVSPPLRAA